MGLGLGKSAHRLLGLNSRHWISLAEILLLKDVGSYKVSDFSFLCSFTGGNMNHSDEFVESLLLCFPNDTPSSLSARLRLVIRRYSKFWGNQRNHQPNDDFPTKLSFRSLYLDYIGYESNHWVPRNGICQGTVACTICWSGCRGDVGCSKRNQLSVLLSGRGSTMMASLARGETPRSLDITMMGTRPYRAGGRKLNENDFKSINEHATQICKDWGYHMIYIYIYMMSFQGLHHQIKHG